MAGATLRRRELHARRRPVAVDAVQARQRGHRARRRPSRRPSCGRLMRDGRRARRLPAAPGRGLVAPDAVPGRGPHPHDAHPQRGRDRPGPAHPGRGRGPAPGRGVPPLPARPGAGLRAVRGRRHIPAIGVRESRRVHGDYRLTRDDVLGGARFDDEIALCGAPIEDHGAGGDTAWQYVGESGVYGIPYRCLLPAGIEGLLMAGRCFSATHDAHASARSMATCMAMGQAAGTAAAMAAAAGTTPRALRRGARPGTAARRWGAARAGGPPGCRSDERRRPPLRARSPRRSVSTGSSSCSAASRRSRRCSRWSTSSRMPAPACSRSRSTPRRPRSTWPRSRRACDGGPTARSSPAPARSWSAASSRRRGAPGPTSPSRPRSTRRSSAPRSREGMPFIPGALHADRDAVRVVGRGDVREAVPGLGGRAVVRPRAPRPDAGRPAHPDRRRRRQRNAPAFLEAGAAAVGVGGAITRAGADVRRAVVAAVAGAGRGGR